MTIALVLAFIGVSVGLRLVSKQELRSWLILAASVLAVFLLQPVSAIRHLDFWLPTATLAVTALCWIVVTPPESRGQAANRSAAGVLVGAVLLLGLTRYFPLQSAWLVVRPPVFMEVFAVTMAVGVGSGVLARTYQTRWKAVLPGVIAALIGLLVVLKTPELSLLVSQGLRGLTQQSVQQASALDLRWLGFSYVCFRLIHTLRDRQKGLLPVVSLRDYMIYVIFFPAFLAGPIDRLEHFVPNLHNENERAEGIALGGQRVLVGLFKKFVLADSLALIALSPANALQVHSPLWLWVLTYAYAFQIYFDFSGYTDLAIGLGLMMGIRLPENFLRPYAQPNLTQFWNNWHITLTQWFRAYYFNPLLRWLRKQRVRLSPVMVVLVLQMSTMVLIGLWHGVMVNFVIWGAWHGVGLFVHNRWSDFARTRLAWMQSKPGLQRSLRVVSTLATFHYVALGWVWFALPTPSLSLSVLARLVGAGG